MHARTHARTARRARTHARTHHTHTHAQCRAALGQRKTYLSFISVASPVKRTTDSIQGDSFGQTCGSYGHTHNVSLTHYSRKANKKCRFGFLSVLVRQVYGVPPASYSLGTIAVRSEGSHSIPLHKRQRRNTKHDLGREYFAAFGYFTVPTSQTFQQLCEAKRLGLCGERMQKQL
eukprot:5425170-Amphidinium_carterae.1